MSKDFRLGNIMETDMRSTLQSQRQFSFGLPKRNSSQGVRAGCKWLFVCRGGWVQAEVYGVDIAITLRLDSAD